MTASDVVAAVFEASHRHDLEAVLDLFTEDGVWDLVPLRKGQGREEIAKLMGPMFDLMPQVEVIVHRQIEVGDLVMHERVDRFQIDGVWREIPVAGVFEIRDGKIALWRDYFCLKTWEQQLSPQAPARGR
jgi:limonene-1,2-epoxide hydrolase